MKRLEQLRSEYESLKGWGLLEEADAELEAQVTELVELATANQWSGAEGEIVKGYLFTAVAEQVADGRLLHSSSF